MKLLCICLLSCLGLQAQYTPPSSGVPLASPAFTGSPTINGAAIVYAGGPESLYLGAAIGNSPTANAVLYSDGSGNLQGAAGITRTAVGLLTFAQTALGSTTANAVYLKNTTVSTAGVTVQVSPAEEYEGHAWNTTSVADNFVRGTLYFLPVSGTAPSGVWHWQQSVDTGTPSFADAMTLTTAGNLTAIGSITSGQNVNLGGANHISFVGRTIIYSGTTSIQLAVVSGATFTEQIGGATSSWPGILSTSQTNPIFSVIDAAGGFTAQLAVGNCAPGGVSGNLCSSGTIQQATEKSCSTGLTTDASGNINGCVASDERLKQNLLPLKADLNAFMGIQTYTYDWIDTAIRDDLHHAGFVAQQMRQVFPYAVVNAGGNHNIGVDPNAVSALTVEVVQQQEREIESLRARVSGLESRPITGNQ